nr:MAG TPA: hypothetical protein [Caudoviricetes sp.]DAP79051.1 MAG TPA: hypothetical protein [Caudoviricetes sp.]DAS26635.1 MAG TPA: hypothetical protein [Caudoviricetes sp.]
MNRLYRAVFAFQAALNRVDTEPLCGGSAAVNQPRAFEPGLFYWRM